MLRNAESKFITPNKKKKPLNNDHKPYNPETLGTEVNENLLNKPEPSVFESIKTFSFFNKISFT